MFCLCYVLPVGQRLHLSDRQWQCPSCHVLHDRDRNAACNILHRGLACLSK
nr:zinc ribbon domain-containing protein [Mitsuokella multacida]